LQPETEAEIEVFLRQASKAGQKLRVTGSGLSPNGLGFSNEGMMTMALMDKIIAVDKDKKQVRASAAQLGFDIAQATHMFLLPPALCMHPVVREPIGDATI
jgi:L-galactono-1,4-lactone dehydrogenase